MRAMGVLLIVFGIIGLAYGGISWTRRDKVVDIGPVEVTTDKRETVPLPPIAGGLCLAAGVALVFAGRSRG